jgi:uncharacterized protein (TIGR03435 family)
MLRLFAVAATFMATFITTAIAQPPLRFEVASIKPFQGSAANVYVNVSGPKVTISEYGLLGLVMTAYRVETWQISGGPPWLESDRFNIAAKAPGDATPDPNQIQQMLQALLADRFKLKVHREKKERPVYTMVLDKKGSKLINSTAASPSFTLGGGVGGMRMAFQKQTMKYLALQLSNSGGLGRQVIDHTALNGTYDFTLNWASGSDGNAPPDSNQPGLVTALQEQLGLKLEPQRAPVEILVIDHAEKPSAN